MVLSINPGPYKPQDTNMEITPYARNAAVKMNFELPVCGACSTDPTSQIFTIVRSLIPLKPAVPLRSLYDGLAATPAVPIGPSDDPF